MNKRMSSTLLYLTRQVSLRYHVNLTSKGKDGVIDVPNAFHTVFTNSKGKYITYDVFAYLTIEIKDGSGTWDRSKSIMLTPRNLFQFQTHLTRAIANIYKQDCFYIDGDNNTRVNKDTLEEYTIQGYNLGTNQRVVIEPSMVYEPLENTEYEGAMFYLNNSDNYFSIAIDVMETMYYILSKVDFMLYTGTMLNYYFQRVLEEDDDNKEEVNVPGKSKSHVFSRTPVEDVPPKEAEEASLKSTLSKKESPEEFFNM